MRKKKKLNTRFPAARIKKIMQSDDNVGKIAKAVPLLISKALELFLQDLCDRTYEIFLTRGAQIVSSMHLKQCVENFIIYDFLSETVREVPDLGDSSAVRDDRLVGRRRKSADFEDEKPQEQSRRKKVRGRGRPRGSRAIKRDVFEDDIDISDLLTSQEYEASLRNFDLNLDLDENGNTITSSAVGSNDI